MPVTRRSFVVAAATVGGIDPSTAVAAEVEAPIRLGQAAGVARPSHRGLWGNISARLAVDGLKRAGGGVDGQRLISALEGMRQHDIGQYLVDFSPTRHHGSRFVDITITGRGGRLVK